MATYTKLKSGEWGVRIECGITPAPGDEIRVSKRDGTIKTERIAKVVWAGGGVHVCAIQPRQTGGASGSPRGGRYECEECGDYVNPGTRCWETGCMH